MKSWDREREREREREKRREGRKEGRGRSEGAVLLLLLLSQSRALLCYLTQLRGKISAPKRYGGGQRGRREGVKGEMSVRSIYTATSESICLKLNSFRNITHL